MLCRAPNDAQNNKKAKENARPPCCLRQAYAIAIAVTQKPNQAKNGILINCSNAIPRIKNEARKLKMAFFLLHLK